jgi:hypothetical protein
VSRAEQADTSVRIALCGSPVAMSGLQTQNVYSGERQRNFSGCLIKQQLSRGGNMQALVEGQTIRHEQYGVGIVTESNNDRTTIDFDDHGVKKFVTSIWTAELIGEPPTERPVRRRGRRKGAKKAAAAAATAVS